MTEEIRCYRCKFGSVPDLPGWKEPEECSHCHDGFWFGFERKEEDDDKSDSTHLARNI